MTASPTSSAGPCLVLGAAGFLGPHAVEAALERARASGSGEVLAHARRAHSPPPGARAVEAELLHEGELERLLEREQPARVLLLAALARIADCERSPSLAQAVNAELPRRTAAWCAAHGARFVHASTDLVFGATDAPPGGLREEHPPAPLSIYGASKADGERAVLAAHPAALVVRLPLLYGESRGRGLGASDSLLAAVARGERPTLFADEWRTPLAAAAAGRALAELLFRPGAPSGLLHVAGTERVERHELGLRVLRAAGHGAESARELVRSSTRADAGQAGSRPRDVSLDCARAKSWLESPLPDLAAGLGSSARAR